MVVGGNGRIFSDDELQCSFFLQFKLGFFGIPGTCSQENGTPENRNGVVAGESSRSGTLKEDINKGNEEEEDDGLREEVEGCSFMAGNTVFLLGVVDEDSILELVLLFQLSLLRSYFFSSSAAALFLSLYICYIFF